MEKQLIAFKQIVSYVSNLTEKKISADIYPVIADKLDMSPKTIETIGKTRKLSSKEIPFVLDALISIIEDERKIRNKENKIFPLNTRILYELSWDFLESSINEKAFIGLLLNNFRIFHNSFDEKRNQYIDKTYSNRFIDFKNIYVKKQSIYNKLLDKIEQKKVTFLVGPPKSGKKYLVQYLVKKDRESDNKFNSYFFFSGKNLNMNFVLSQIIRSFTGHDLVNYTLEIKKDKVKKYLTAQKSLIVIEDFNMARLDVLKELFDFFSLPKEIENTRILVLGVQKERRVTSMLNDMHISNASLSVTFDFDMEEWQSYANQMIENSREIRNAVNSDPSLIEWCYNLNKKNIYLLGDILARISNEVSNSSDNNIEKEKEIILNSVYNAAESDDKLEKMYNAFSGNRGEDEKNLLTIISLFNDPVDYDELKRIWWYYTENSKDDTLKSKKVMRKLIDSCCDKLYLEKNIDKKTSEYLYKVPHVFKVFIRKKLMENDETCLQAADVWIKYYVKETVSNNDSLFSKELGRKLEDNKPYGNMRLSIVLKVLDYCEEKQRWEDYYNLCWNMRYYFFNTGLCGSGTESYMYKCALAARKLGNYNEEYAALLYFCNIGSRLREFQLVEEAFDRIDYINVNTPELDKRLRCKCYYVRAINNMSNLEFNAANNTFDTYLVTSQKLLQEYNNDISNDNQNDVEHLKRDILSAKKWKCECLCHLAKNNSSSAEKYCAEANLILDKTQSQFEKNGNYRRAAHCIFSRARINFYAFGINDEVEKYLKDLDEVKSILSEDSYYSGKYSELMTEVSAARNIQKKEGKNK